MPISSATDAGDGGSKLLSVDTQGGDDGLSEKDGVVDSTVQYGGNLAKNREINFSRFIPPKCIAK
jgi:hypothetical protein